jgi:RNA recognition motif-containing protein
MSQTYEGRRLYVGGLEKMIDQPQHVKEVMELFSDFTPCVGPSFLISHRAFVNDHECTRSAIGKRVTPHESTRSRRGNHHYCFVDFETKEQANAAMTALNGRVILGGRLKVAVAAGIPDKLVPDTGARSGRRVYDDNSRSGKTAPSSRATASTDWRRRDAE